MKKALLLLLLIITTCSCTNKAAVQVSVEAYRVERPPDVVLQPLDADLHFCDPENLERIFANTLELTNGVQLRDAALDAYEAQLKRGRDE